MKVTNTKAVTLIVFVMSSLLVLAANCSFEKKTDEASVEQQVKEDYYKQKESNPSSVANSYCFVCHLDFEQEELALDHELAGIGCERCHGESTRHRSDEANITPPEIMYPKARINPTCMMCHPRHEIRHVKDHQRLLARVRTIFDEEAEDSASAHKVRYCTDCHAGQHLIRVRTVRWNKATGELIEN